ncbi:hypothetical protein [Paraburkholderia youngii]
MANNDKRDSAGLDFTEQVGLIFLVGVLVFMGLMVRSTIVAFIG